MTFREALRQWVKCVLENVTEGDVIIQPRFRWISADGTIRTQVFDPIRFWSYKLTGPDRFPDAWQQLEQSAQQWPALNAALGKQFETAGGSMIFDLLRVIPQIIPQPGFDVQRQALVLPKFSDQWFTQEYDRFAAFVEGSHITVETRILLNGIAFEEGQLPCRLSGDSEIRALSEPEIQHLGELGYIYTPLGLNGDYLWSPHQRPCVILRRVVPKHIYDHREKNEERDARWQRYVEEFTRFRENLVAALALANYSNAGLGGGYTTVLDWNYGGSSLLPPAYLRTDFRVYEPPSVFDAEDCATMRNIFDTLDKRRPSDDAVSTAIRRLSYAMEEYRSEERLLDDMIAAEAIFGDREAKTEMRYRISLRAAFALYPDDPEQRRKAFLAMRSAYDVRSALAHGGKPNPKDVKIDGETVDLQTFVRHVEDYVRQGVRKALLSSTGAFSADKWDDAILGKV